MITMMKSDRARRLIRAHGVKSELHLIPCLLPLATFSGFVFTNIQGGQRGATIHEQLEGKFPVGRIAGRRMPTVST